MEKTLFGSSFLPLLNSLMIPFALESSCATMTCFVYFDFIFLFAGLCFITNFVLMRKKKYFDFWHTNTSVGWQRLCLSPYCLYSTGGGIRKNLKSWMNWWPQRLIFWKLRGNGMPTVIKKGNDIGTMFQGITENVIHLIY